MEVGERFRIVEELTTIVERDGKALSDTDFVSRYALSLIGCTVRLIKNAGREHNPVIEIVEHTIDPRVLQAYGGNIGFTCDRVRIVYSGSYEGLAEVSLEAVSGLDPKTGEFRQLGSSLLRFSDLKGDRALTGNDIDVYDVYLQYAHAQIFSPDQ